MDASLNSAKVGIQAAQTGVEIAGLQYEIVLREVRIGELPSRSSAWDRDPPAEFDLPTWYFCQEEALKIADKGVANAQEDLQIEQANLDDVLNKMNHPGIRMIEKRLGSAQFNFELIETKLDREIEQNREETISNYLSSLLDAAEPELESPQPDYERVLADQGAEDLLDARARVALTEERLQLALAKYHQLQKGHSTIEVPIAELAILQANSLLTIAESSYAEVQAGKEQAEKLLEQASSNLVLIDLQIEKLVVAAHTDGVVLAKTIQLGELLQPGVAALHLGKLSNLTISVYVPGDEYGRISLGDEVEVRVDSYPDQVFTAVVTQIADEAQYTPGNVQTEAYRRTAVFGISLALVDGFGQLKP